MRICFLHLIILISATCCSAQRREQEYYRVDLTDRFLADAITQYVNDNKIDLKKQVITIKVSGDQKNTFTFTDEITALHKTRFVPNYYGMLDGRIAFFVYAKTEQAFRTKSKTIVHEIDQFLAANNIVLPANTGLTYSSPVWRVTRECDKKYFLNKSAGPFEFEDMPCGYHVIRDSVKLDSLKLIKK